MNEATGDIKFEAKDFERYYSGEMTGKEMYALEKAALADPFLQDALEGYKYTRSAVSDMQSLQQQLSNRLEEKKEARVIPFYKNNFLKAAVFIAFLAGAALIFLKQNNKVVENNTLASTSAAEIKEVKVDSGLGAIQNEVALQETPGTPAVPVIILNKNAEDKDMAAGVIQADKRKAPTAPSLLKTSADDISVASASTVKADKLNESYLLKGKVVNELGEPIPFASIVTSEEQINTDIAGNYSAIVKDSSIYGNVVASGYQPLQKKLNPNLPQTIVLNTETAKIAKLEQAEKSASAKKSAEITKDTRIANGVAIEANNVLTPSIGWTKYEQYLRDSVRYQSALRALVQLSFTVNAQGRPQEIKVTDGLCLPCNTEAIRLLKDGPDWNTLPKGKGILKMQF